MKNLISFIMLLTVSLNLYSQPATSAAEKYDKAELLFKKMELDKAQQATINAIISDPGYQKNHLLLYRITKARGERAKSLLPLYYYLMLSQKDMASPECLKELNNQLNYGISLENEKKINVRMPNSTSDKTFGETEITLSFFAASKYMIEFRDKNDTEFMKLTNECYFKSICDTKTEQSFWFDFYVKKFKDMYVTENCEAFNYYILQSSGNEEIKNWIATNPQKMDKLQKWIENQK